MVSVGAPMLALQSTGQRLGASDLSDPLISDRE